MSEDATLTEKSLRNAIASLETTEVTQRFLNRVIDKEGANIAIAHFHQMYEDLTLRDRLDRDAYDMLVKSNYDYLESNHEKLRKRSEQTKRRTFLKMMAGVAAASTSGYFYNKHNIEHDTTGSEAHPATAAAEGLTALGAGAYVAVQVYKGFTQPDAGRLDTEAMYKSLGQILDNLVQAYDKEMEQANRRGNGR